MLLNRLEYILMNNPVRAAIQRHVFGSFAWFIARKAARSPIALVK